MRETSVVLANVTKKFGPATAVRSVSWSPRRGQVTALVGLNGAGKSTLMRVMTGLIKQTEGSVSVAAEQGRRPLSAMIEAPALFTGLTVRRNLRIHRILTGADPAEIDAVAALAQIEHVMPRRVSTLSQGYHQRVAIAVALLRSPAVLLLDEPTNALDPEATAHLRVLLRRVADRGTAVIVSTHMLRELEGGPQHEPPLWGFRQAAILIATLLMGRAATVAAGDFSTGTIRPWIISIPSRGPVFLGKLAASMSIAVGVCAIAGSTGYAVSGVLGTVPAPTDIAVATAQLAIACAALTVFGHAVGVMTRSVPAALTITIAWILPAEAVLKGRSPELHKWLPGSVLHDITLGHIAVGGTPLSALAHATLPLVLLDGVALAIFLRRDINS